MGGGNIFGVVGKSKLFQVLLVGGGEVVVENGNSV